GLANSSDVLAKRGYVLGQYSRFVRPDYYRIGVVTNQGSAMVSAFKDPVSSKFAIVAVNAPNLGFKQAFNLVRVGAVTNVTPCINSAALSLASQPSVSVTNSAFTYQLPAMSVVTFVGIVPPLSSPVFTSINSSANQVFLTFNGPAGPSYTLLTSTNLLYWQPLLVTNPPALPLTLVLTNPPAAQSFYRLQLGP